uniref:(northern house mosquito) hypothetical protein n=1 Tax=Culex pipiens TaxID=7175 RepID=A0A8D8ESW8_CULPI
MTSFGQKGDQLLAQLGSNSSQCGLIFLTGWLSKYARKEVLLTTFAKTNGNVFELFTRKHKQKITEATWKRKYLQNWQQNSLKVLKNCFFQPAIFWQKIRKALDLSEVWN